MQRTGTDGTPALNDASDRLKWSRQQAGLQDATAAARRNGWTVPTYLSHENGQRGISKKAAIKYAKAFKVDAAWLLYGREMMVPPIDPELVNLWRNLSGDQQQIIKRLMRALASEADDTPSVDALLRDQPEAIRQQAIAIIKAIRK